MAEHPELLPAIDRKIADLVALDQKKAAAQADHARRVRADEEKRRRHLDELVGAVEIAQQDPDRVFGDLGEITNGSRAHTDVHMEDTDEDLPTATDAILAPQPTASQILKPLLPPNSNVPGSTLNRSHPAFAVNIGAAATQKTPTGPRPQGPSTRNSSKTPKTTPPGGRVGAQ